MRVKLILSYDGSAFFGSQIQKDKKSVNGDIDKALKLLNINSKINASGRTDRAVHALNQVIDFEIPNFWNDLEKLKNSLNYILMPNIYIKKLKKVEESFHSRFLAKKRVYRYVISTKTPNPFEAKYITFINKKDINIEIIKIKDAIKIFNGVHNFKYFKKNGSDNKNDTREIYKTNFYKYREYYIFYFEANSFLRSQIRLMVGFLLEISKGNLTKEDLKLQLNCKKNLKIKLAPPDGLYLSRIKY